MSDDNDVLLPYKFNIDITFIDLILKLSQDNLLTSNVDEKVKLNQLSHRHVVTMTN